MSSGPTTLPCPPGMDQTRAAREQRKDRLIQTLTEMSGIKWTGLSAGDIAVSWCLLGLKREEVLLHTAEQGGVLPTDKQ